MDAWLQGLEAAAMEAADAARTNGYAFAERGFGRVRVGYQKQAARFSYHANNLVRSRAQLSALDTWAATS